MNAGPLSAHIYISNLYTTSLIENRVSSSPLEKTLKLVKNSVINSSECSVTLFELDRIKNVLLRQNSKVLEKKEAIIQELVSIIAEKLPEQKFARCRSDMQLFRKSHSSDFGFDSLLDLGNLSNEELARVYYLNRPGESDV